MSIVSRLKSRLSSVMGAVILGLAATFNRNVTAPHVVAPLIVPAKQKGRKRKYRTGIKGVKGTNHSQYGHDLVQRIAETRRLKAYRKQMGVA